MRKRPDCKQYTHIIFITAHRDIPMTGKAMKAGAVEFLTKPFREQDILDAVRAALERDRQQPRTWRKGPRITVALPNAQ
ncbi:MAG: response regulator [Xanthobacteraceae bacterium]